MLKINMEIISMISYMMKINLLLRIEKLNHGGRWFDPDWFHHNSSLSKRRSINKINILVSFNGLGHRSSKPTIRVRVSTPRPLKTLTAYFLNSKHGAVIRRFDSFPSDHHWVAKW